MASIQKYKTATGTAWRVQYRDPAQKLRTKQGFKAKVQAQAWAAENTTALNSGAWVDPTAGNITVAVIAEPVFVVFGLCWLLGVCAGCGGFSGVSCWVVFGCVLSCVVVEMSWV